MTTCEHRDYKNITCCSGFCIAWQHGIFHLDSHCLRVELSFNSIRMTMKDYIDAFSSSFRSKIFDNQKGLSLAYINIIRQTILLDAQMHHFSDMVMAQ